MNGAGNLILRWLGMHDRGEHGAVHSPKELEMLVIQSRKAGLLQAQEEELLRHVFDFEETEVRQVLTAERYTRYPVYEKTIDTVIGMLHLKDLADYSTALKDPASFDLRQMLRPVLDVPELSSIGDLLTRMQRERIHLAVVIDEYGATAGIVTMEDIVEELVGEVQDEFDILQEGVRPEIEVLPDGSSSVDGLLALTDFTERFNVQITSAHAQTLGGTFKSTRTAYRRWGIR